jgi:putative Mg2+ transporter-C (MgtC) family protein
MEILFTLALSFVLAFFVGMERQLSKKPVGFAPYIFVTVLSTALTLIGASAFPGNPALVNGIITGIGFLGAGALIKFHEKVFGFTTAASIWAMAGLGIIVALGDVPFIAASYIVVWVTIVIDRLIELRGLGRHMRNVTIEAKGTGSHKDIKDIIGKYRQAKEEGMEMNFDRGVVEYKFIIPSSAKIEEMFSELSSLKDIKRIDLD